MVTGTRDIWPICISTRVHLISLGFKSFSSFSSGSSLFENWPTACILILIYNSDLKQRELIPLIQNQCDSKMFVNTKAITKTSMTRVSSVIPMVGGCQYC